MTELTTDEKIERLVRSVLAAVDQRLDSVRADVAQVAADADAKHRQLLAALAERERAEAAPQHDMTEVDERIARLERMLDELRAEVRVVAAGVVASPAAATPASPAPNPPTSPAPMDVDLSLAPVPDSLRDLSRMSAPLLTGSPSGQVPIVTDDEPIDVDRLTSILTERLGSLRLELRIDS